MSIARRSFLAAVSAAILAPFAKPDPPQEFYAKVGKIALDESDPVNPIQESKLTFAPSAASVGISGDLSGLSEGDYIPFHIERSEVVWKGRHIHVRNVELTP